MNRFAALIDRLVVAADEEMKQRLLADYFASTPEADRAIAIDILGTKRKWRRVRLPLLRGLADARLDAALFALSLDFVGDVGETIALLWPAQRGANRDPSLSDIVDGLSTLGRSELPKRIEAWLDASDANGRWALIKLLTGTLGAPVTKQDIACALTAVGFAAVAAEMTSAPEIAQDEMFDAPPAETAIPGSVHAVLLYIERGRAKSSPLVCTVGIWNAETLVPIGKANVGEGDERDRIETFARENLVARFGPVHEVAHTRETGLVVDVAFEGLRRSSRRKAGIILQTARLNRVCPEKSPSQADDIEALERLLPAR